MRCAVSQRPPPLTGPGDLGVTVLRGVRGDPWLRGDIGGLVGVRGEVGVPVDELPLRLGIWRSSPGNHYTNQCQLLHTPV